ncbi:hypothetical protein [Heyndrickxia ginsengihumi]|uniref:hypothetical protein n=1 Tax=Heyndrickxia ginsengihumi TaxID=363870 RepID=UPI003D1E933E
MFLINGTMLIAGGSIVLLAMADKTAESYGIHWLGAVVKVLLPIAGFAAIVYFGDSSAVRGLLR